MKKKTYWDKLKDPRWQKLRLEAMQDRDFHCEVCFDGESTLNVHHKEYFKDFDPWDYEIDQLAVLCEGCHEQQHIFDFLKWACSYARLEGPGNREELAFIVGGFIGIPYEGMLSISLIDDIPYYRELYRLSAELQDKALEVAMAENKKKVGDK